MNRTLLLVTVCLAAVGCTGERESPPPDADRAYRSPIREGAFSACPDPAGSLLPGAGEGAAATALRFVSSTRAGRVGLADDAAGPNRLIGTWPSGRALGSGSAARDDLVTFACGQDVARRSWRVTIDDGSRSASLDFWLYLIRRPDGWKVWGAY